MVPERAETLASASDGDGGAAQTMEADVALAYPLALFSSTIA